MWIPATQFNNTEQFGRPWIPAFELKNTDQSGGPLNPLYLFKNTDQFGGQWTPASQFKKTDQSFFQIFFRPREKRITEKRIFRRPLTTDHDF